MTIQQPAIKKAGDTCMVCELRCAGPDPILRVVLIITVFIMIGQPDIRAVGVPGKIKANL